MGNPLSFTGDSLLSRYAEDMNEVALYLWQKGWAERNAGNISVDVTGLVKSPRSFKGYAKYPLNAEGIENAAGRIYIVTVTGARFRDIKKDRAGTLVAAAVAADLSGYYVLSTRGPAAPKATSEFASHLMLHSYLKSIDSDKKAVIHTHPDRLIALSHLKGMKRGDSLSRVLWSMHPEVRVVLPEGIGFVPYRCPGSAALASATLKAMKGRSVSVWEKHGVIAAGKDVFEAFDLIDTLDKAANIYLLCRMAGEKPAGLSRKEIDGIDRAFFPAVK